MPIIFVSCMSHTKLRTQPRTWPCTLLCLPRSLQCPDEALHLQSLQKLWHPNVGTSTAPIFRTSIFHPVSHVHPVHPVGVSAFSAPAVKYSTSASLQSPKESHSFPNEESKDPKDYTIHGSAEGSWIKAAKNCRAICGKSAVLLLCEAINHRSQTINKSIQGSCFWFKAYLHSQFQSDLPGQILCKLAFISHTYVIKLSLCFLTAFDNDKHTKFLKSQHVPGLQLVNQGTMKLCRPIVNFSCSMWKCAA